MVDKGLLTKEKFLELQTDINKIRAVGNELSRLGAIFANSLHELEHELNVLYQKSKGG
ncbi:unnamed protein product [marine sediment metagenome]|uniref:Uncharacterized protein n=1 Tax=marine sediment metagenome TaxID=412755 RepID=X1IFM0_9ZZZZ